MRISVHLEHLSKEELSCFRIILENYEGFTLMLMQPFLISKIGAAILLQNWLYLHVTGNFIELIHRVYKYSSVISKKLCSTFVDSGKIM